MNLSLVYIDEIARLSDSYNNKIFDLEERISNLEKNLESENSSESDEIQISLTESITCPYCKKDFEIDCESQEKEVICPNCDNLIALDWGGFEDDM